jgi:hypothetical protein
MDAKAPARIGELLIHLGLLTESDLMEASHVAVDLGLPLGQALVMSDYISESQLKAIIQAQSMLKDGVVSLETVAKAMKIVGETEYSWDDALAQCGFAPDKNAPRNMFGDLLVEAEVLTQADVDKALHESIETGMPMGRVLAASGKLSPTVLNSCLNAQVLLRDGRITRAQAVNALWSAFAKQTSLEEELKRQGVYQPPSGARMRLGELLVMAGVLSEHSVLDALEVCLMQQKMIGEVLLELQVISPHLLENALKIQDAVDSRVLTPMAGSEALRRIQSRGITAERAIVEMGLWRSSPAERMKIGEFLVLAGAITQDQLQDAIRLSTSNNALIGKILLMSNVLDKRTLHNALRCQFFMREGALTEEQAVSLLQHCHRNQMSVDQAFGDASAVDMAAIPTREPQQT